VILDDYGDIYKRIFLHDGHATNAYLLFYAKFDLIAPEGDEGLTEPGDVQLVATIEAESRTTMKLEAIFSPGIMHVIMHEIDLDLLLLIALICLLIPVVRPMPVALHFISSI
jgi:hypothetical protein